MATGCRREYLWSALVIDSAGARNDRDPAPDRDADRLVAIADLVTLEARCTDYRCDADRVAAYSARFLSSYRSAPMVPSVAGGCS